MTTGRRLLYLIEEDKRLRKVEPNETSKDKSKEGSAVKPKQKAAPKK